MLDTIPGPISKKPHVLKNFYIAVFAFDKCTVPVVIKLGNGYLKSGNGYLIMRNVFLSCSQTNLSLKCPAFAHFQKKNSKFLKLKMFLDIGSNMKRK